MKRNVLFALLTTVFVLAIGVLSACGGTSTPVETDPPAPTATSVPEEEPTEAEEEPSPEPTEVDDEPTPEPTAEEPTEPPAADGEGLVLLEERCAVCHSLDRVTRASKSREQWEQTVDRMIDRGAELNDDERAILIDYLTETYGP